jgi:TolB-like protein
MVRPRGHPRRQCARRDLSIVVPSFTNLSGDASQDYFADGVTENRTTDLVRIRDSFVIADEARANYGKRWGRRAAQKIE